MERNRFEQQGSIARFETYAEEPLHECVKCVVIGDTAVGKTRLICSHVYRYDGMPLEYINKSPHLPTVFAIDQYMSEPIVRERAKYIIDGVHVSLRIWDTFGDRGKNRKFAYQQAHVVVLCYSIGMPDSLRNINARWFSEIRKYCPRAPVILVGTQLDRRYTDPNLFRTVGHAGLRSYLAGVHQGPCSHADPLVPPDLGRQTAREISAVGYYETSIITKHGVDHVFENAIRAALTARRKCRPLLCSHLKRVERPTPQKPYLPPNIKAPSVHVPPSDYAAEHASLYGNTQFADILFMVEGEPIYAHAVILIASCQVFAHLLLNSVVISKLHPCDNDDVLHTLASSAPSKLVACQDGFANGTPCSLPRGFAAIDTVFDQSLDCCKIIVKVTGVTSNFFKMLIEFIYTGAISDLEDPMDAITMATFIQISSMSEYIRNVVNDSEYENIDLNHDLRIHFVADVYRHFFNKPLYSDVIFMVDNTEVPAHKALLIPHCPVMAGMFRNGHFRESGTEKINFNDTNLQSFIGVLEYIYTGNCSVVHMVDATGILKLANFLCLPRLVCICEQYIIKETEASLECNPYSIMDNIFSMLHVSQLHNASRLTAWCLYYMTTNYNELCRKHAKELNQLNVATLKYLDEHRWPPVWYLKEYDVYVRASTELEIEKERKERSRSKRKCKSCF
eukprot:gene5407-6083_t